MTWAYVHIGASHDRAALYPPNSNGQQTAEPSGSRSKDRSWQLFFYSRQLCCESFAFLTAQRICSRGDRAIQVVLVSTPRSRDSVDQPEYTRYNSMDQDASDQPAQSRTTTRRPTLDRHVSSPIRGQNAACLLWGANPQPARELVASTPLSGSLH